MNIVTYPTVATKGDEDGQLSLSPIIIIIYIDYW